jgi:hypothetical protein
MEIGNPPAFKGTSDVWCPEDLLIGAVNACLMLTFLYQMQLRKLAVIDYESSAKAPWNITMGNIASLGLQSNLAFLSNQTNTGSEPFEHLPWSGSVSLRKC